MSQVVGNVQLSRAAMSSSSTDTTLSSSPDIITSTKISDGLQHTEMASAPISRIAPVGMTANSTTTTTSTAATTTISSTTFTPAATAANAASAASAAPTTTTTNTTTTTTATAPTTATAATALTASTSSIDSDAPTERLSTEGLKATLNRLKNDLKSPPRFISAVERLIILMQQYLEKETKQLFYNCLNIISFRLRKLGFSSPAVYEVAKKVLDLALSDEKAKSWSPGYLRNIKAWIEVVESLINNTFNEASYVRIYGDGRFGTVNPAAQATGIRRSSGISSISLWNSIFSDLFNSRINDSDSDSSEDEFYIRPSFGLMSSYYPFLARNETSRALLQQVRLPHDNKSKEFVFNVDKEMYKRVKEDKNQQIHIYVQDAGTSFLANSLKSPEGVEFHVNNGRVPLNGAGHQIKFGYDASAPIVHGRNVLKIVSPMCVCRYTFSLVMVDVKTIATFIKEIQERVISKELSLSKVKKLFTGNDDLEQLHITVSLMCPLSQDYIEIPVVAETCKHFQCFDLESYLLMQLNEPTWKCPLCAQRARPEDLKVDLFFKEILDQVGGDDNGESILLRKDGSWEVFKIAFADHSSDSEAEDKPQKKRASSPTTEEPPLKRRVLPPPPTEIIDLT